MTYMPSHIANYMLDRGEEEGRAISPMKLLKLVYIGYGWSLAVLDEQLFDEPIYAWQHGPVVRSLYDEFKHYGKAAIDTRAVDFDLDEGKLYTPRIAHDDEDADIVLGKVWDVYSRFSAWDLRNKTHEAGTPWSQVYQSDTQNVPIPDDIIKSHFQMKIRQYLDNAS